VLLCVGFYLLLQRRAPEWEHLGLLGPIIRGTVGDTILVTFKNMLPGHNVSIHAHGVLYDKESEGSPYYDGLPGEQSLL
jgi:FtsP/CotA-like multicopper oxidase with cupredoxin domain